MNRQSSCDSESILSRWTSPIVQRIFWRLWVVAEEQDLDAYASLRPSCLRRGVCELKRLSRQPPRALRHCVSALRLPSVLQLCARDS